MGSLLKDRSFIGYALVVGFIHGEALLMYLERHLFIRISMGSPRRCLVYYSVSMDWQLSQAAFSLDASAGL